MVAPYVDGAAILAHVAGGGTPSADAGDVAWADQVAAAVNGAILTRLDGSVPLIDSAEQAELEVAAVQDGAAAYLARKAPHGVMALGPDGDAVRLGANIVRALGPVFDRYHPQVLSIG